jgi:hypothetical protein
MSNRSLHFQIATTENKPMKAWDLVLQVGGFKSQADAEKFAEAMNKFMEENCNASSARVQ